VKGVSNTQIHQSIYCNPNENCASSKFPSPATYDPSNIEEYPTRKNIHRRHNPMSYQSDKVKGGMNSFLHPMLPENYISGVPAPPGAIAETGLQYPWQTPSRWTYPAGLTTQGEEINRDGIPHDPNNSTGGIPDAANEECLKRTDIPWEPKKGTKVYLKVLQQFFGLTLGCG
jgi:hypothetical protein